VLSLYEMATWNLQIGYWQVVIPTVMFGFGFSTIFPPLAAATLSCVERERMGYAASLFSMIRNTGASMGISMMTSMLVSHQQIHQSYLAEHFSVFDAWRMQMAPQRMPGAPHLLGGRTQSLAMVYGQIRAQSSMLSFNDIYRMLLYIETFVVPVLLLLWIWQERKVVRPLSGQIAAAH
jgi:DHA2 family multidrug resistance protein